ncbi:DUF927 domain-containing protein [Fodinicurvata fenggangensis]|uniref:DUF927 domain-containing protein n=1 Tax=Fodinicurvata fenggangensis TaxID=1121830 RepID=UPI000689CEF8|nr:DUF927 domain-containing protein [Fodinicurvata fenggangensis]
MTAKADVTQMVDSDSGYSMRRNGLFWKDPSDPEKPEMKIAGPFEIMAETRDAEGGNWGVLLRWWDNDDREHEWPMPRSLLASDGAEVRRILLDGGLFVASSQSARNKLTNYLASAKAKTRARAVSQTGWHDGVFVLPEWTAGNSEERVILQSAGAIDHAFRRQGTLEEWQVEVAALAIGNSRLIAAICSALAAPLLHVAGSESGGLHFRGSSSTGKTTALNVGASAWGGGGIAGYIRSWRATSNGLEAVAAAHCDALLCLDELGQVAAKEAGEVAYMLSNGSGKSRAARDGGGRRPAQWRLLFLSSGEIGLATKVAEDGRGRRLAAGQQVRVVDVPADAGAGHGIFEELHGHETGDALARKLKQATTRHYGHAAPALIQQIVQNPDWFGREVRAFIEEFSGEACPTGADGQVQRVAQRFGLLAAAGEIAAKLEILPWPEGGAIEGCQRCFQAWLDSRGGPESAEVRDGIAKVRAFVEAHGESRFAPWQDDSHKTTINRAGFRRTTDGGGSEWFVFSEAWAKEICEGFDPTLVAKALADRGMLKPGKDGKRLQSRQRLPGFAGPVRCYHLTDALLAGGEADD